MKDTWSQKLLFYSLYLLLVNFINISIFIYIVFLCLAQNKKWNICEINECHKKWISAQFYEWQLASIPGLIYCICSNVIKYLTNWADKEFWVLASHIIWNSFKMA